MVWGGADFIGGITSRRLGSVLVVSLLSEAVAMVVAIAILLIVRPELPGAGFLPFAVLAGLLEAIAIVSLYRGLSLGAMGVVSPITACSAIIPVAFGLALGESLSTAVALGIPLAFIGVVAVAWTPSETDDSGGQVSAGVGLAVIAAAGFGGFVVVIDEAVAQAGVVWSVAVARTTFVLATGLAALLVRPSLRGASRFTVPLVALGLLELSAVTLIAAATAEGLLAVVGVLAALYPIITLLLARFVLD